MIPYQYSRAADIEARRRLYGDPQKTYFADYSTVLFAVFCVSVTALALVLLSGVHL